MFLALSLSRIVEPVVGGNNKSSIVLINIHDTILLLCCDHDNIDIYNAVFNDKFDSNLCNSIDHI